MMSDTKTGHDTGLIERAFLMGLGAAAIATERVRDLADELVRRGELSREQEDSFVNRLSSQAQDARMSVQDAIGRETERVVAGMGLASVRDVDEIRADLTEIKALIAALRPDVFTAAEAGHGTAGHQSAVPEAAAGYGPVHEPDAEEADPDEIPGVTSEPPGRSTPGW